MNKRTDRYGGSVENRTRFAEEIVDAVVAKVGESKTGLRLSPWSRYEGMLPLLASYDLTLLNHIS